MFASEPHADKITHVYHVIVLHWVSRDNQTDIKLLCKTPHDYEISIDLIKY